MNRFLVIFAVVCLFAASPLAAAGAGGPVSSPDLYSGLRWRNIGPFRAGWSTCAEGIPDQPDVFYFGAAGGGVWKTDDAGRTWEPLFSTSSRRASTRSRSHRRTRTSSTSARARSRRATTSLRATACTGPTTAARPGGTSASPRRAHIGADPRRSAESGRRAGRGAGAHLRPEPGARRLPHRPTAARAGRKRCSSTRTPARSISRPIRRDPTVVYAALWQVRNHPWLVYFQPDMRTRERRLQIARTAARPGDGCRAAAGRRAAASAASASPSRRADACTRPSTLATRRKRRRRGGAAQPDRPLPLGRRRRALAARQRRAMARKRLLRRASPSIPAIATRST